MAGVTSRAVTIAAKFVGGDLIKKGAEEGAEGIDKLGKSVSDSDDKASKSGSGWNFFSRETDKADKSSKKASLGIGSLGKSLLGMAVGFGGGILALSAIKTSLNSVGEKAVELKQAEALGIGENSKQTLAILSAYKARGIGMTQLATTSKMLSKSAFTAEQQESKHAKAGARTAESRYRQEETYQRALAKWRESGKGPPPLPLAAPKEAAELGIKAKAYQTLGIVVSQFRKLSATKQLEEVGEKLTKMPIGPERTRLATELLGRSASKILPAFEQGEGSIKSMTKYAEKAFSAVHLGAKETEQYHIQQMKMNIDMEAFKLQIGVFVLPIMAKLIKTFTELYTNITTGKGAWGPLESIIKGTVGMIVEVVDWFKRTEWAGKALIGVLVVLAAAWGVEKIIKTYQAFKKLQIIEFITKLLKANTTATEENGAAQAAAGAEGDAAAAGGLARFAGGLGSVARFAGIATLAIGATIGVAEVMSHILGKGSFIENVKEFLSGHNAAYWEKKQEGYEETGVRNQTSADKQLLAARRAHPKVAARLIAQEKAGRMKHMPHLAQGGYVRHGGMAVVGENGPEPVTLPSGAIVEPLGSSRGQGGAGTYEDQAGDLHIHVQIDRAEIAQAVLKEFRFRGARA